MYDKVVKEIKRVLGRFPDSDLSIADVDENDENLVVWFDDGHRLEIDADEIAYIFGSRAVDYDDARNWKRFIKNMIGAQARRRESRCVARRDCDVMDEKLAGELVRIARELVGGGILDDIKEAVEAASSFMNVGKELKRLGVKFDFSFFAFGGIYTIKDGGSKYAIVSKKFADDPDFVSGDIAVGRL